jgi:glycosyltransferase involved in cell wall biosynthesis
MAGISVIIPVRNGEKSIRRCIESVLASRYPPEQMEVICVDNGSSDGTSAVLREFQPRIRVLQESRRGPAAARNAGLRAATREFVAFTDADCFVDVSWLDRILKPLHAGAGTRQPIPSSCPRADRESPEALRRMLDVEAQLGVRATYNVVGLLLGDTRDAIERGGHAVAFHSYDHRIPADADAALDQFRQCRDLEYRLKGYRVPQSKLTRGVTDADFAEWNFEWLARPRYSLDSEIPVMSNGIVKIPVHANDYPMFREGVPFESWQRQILDLADARDFVVVGLHDCYAHLWLPHYQSFLRELQRRASLITLDEVAARVTLGRSR